MSSAVVHFPVIWGSAAAHTAWPAPEASSARKPVKREGESFPAQRALDSSLDEEEARSEGPVANLAFYRRHTESLLRRYLYASMQVGRTPSILGDPVVRGAVSSRRLRTFEDAVIFVLDVESCLGKLGALQKALIGRIVLQEYTQAEAAAMLGMSARAVNYKLQEALDAMTEVFLDSGMLDLPY